ncbi:katanin p80 WD40 repeat-containing subunit B1 isoform X2 [Pleurodeles waltl]|uniref:katanin p80 WD40 repeat-containing subunit B1 isoform X2 n=1 Tax=Pleurodeles waltl TaxID=8319 RepID=UPI0037095729
MTALKMQEFVAHKGNVSAVALGKASGRLLATAGDDFCVNVWNVNKPNCIMSLTGHTTPVEALRFNVSEEWLVAGSQSGSLRLWDLKAAKSVRPLPGHKANICSLDFHPFTEIVASGSVDSGIKIWDIRRKGCIFRYKGHTQPVRCLRFSPDGKWLASCADDHTVKLWDLTVGKVLADFTEHTGPVNIVEFHPNEFLLASGSSDRTIRYWDLEKFQIVGCTESGTNAVRSMLFDPDGGCLYSGSQDSLRVYGWEPERCFDMVPVNWGKVADMGLCLNHLIGVSFATSVATTYKVDLNRVVKTASARQEVAQDEQPLSHPTPKGASLRRIYERPSTSSSKPQRFKQNSDNERRSPSSEDDRDEKESMTEIQNPEDYNEIFQPKTAISRTPPRKTDPFPAPVEDESIVKEIVKPSIPVEVLTPAPKKANPEHLQQAPIASSTPNERVPESPIISITRTEPVGLKASDFLPPSNKNQSEVVDEDAMSQIRKGHDTMCMVLTSRARHLDSVRAVWSTGDIKTSVDSAIRVDDLSVMVDVLNIVNQKASLWKLDLCTSVLPQIEKLLQSKYESYMQTGCASLKLILQRFLPIITDILSAPPSVGVDISREERLEKCQQCHMQLCNISKVIKSKTVQSGRQSSAFRELQLLMASLE